MTSAIAAIILLASGASSGVLQIEGEVIATRSATLAAPPLVFIWQLNIAEMVPEGSMVKKGEVVVRFETTELEKQLLDNQNKLNEKQRERDKLRLSLADNARDEQLKTAEARAELEKAVRKASQPEEVVRGIDYKKLVIDRERRERRMALYEQREQAAAEKRAAELRLVEVEIKRHELEVARLTANIESLAVKAPMDGMMLHRSGWNGVKFDVGSQVFIGLPVAEIPDMQSLAVRGLLPERELTRVAMGARVTVHVEGGSGATLGAQVKRIGRVVRSKSRVQPIPIVELFLELDRRPNGIRPGQPVRIELDTSANMPGGGAE
jgi:HlyD family secretion protein